MEYVLGQCALVLSAEVVRVLVAGVLYHLPDESRLTAGVIAFVFLYLVAKILARMNSTAAPARRNYRFAE